MITVTVYCKYPRFDGTINNAVVRKRCFKETQIANAEKKALQCFEKKYTKTAARGVENYITMVVTCARKKLYYDTDSCWCYIKPDGSVFYNFF